MIYKDGDTLQVFIKSKKDFPSVVFYLLWLCFWTIAESGMIMNLLSLDSFRDVHPSIAFVMVFWTLGGIVTMLNLLWLLDGEEHITVDLDVLELSRKILGIGPVRKYNIWDQVHVI